MRLQPYVGQVLDDCHPDRIEAKAWLECFENDRHYTAPILLLVEAGHEGRTGSDPLCNGYRTIVCTEAQLPP